MEYNKMCALLQKVCIQFVKTCLQRLIKISPLQYQNTFYALEQTPDQYPPNELIKSICLEQDEQTSHIHTQVILIIKITQTYSTLHMYCETQIILQNITTNSYKHYP